MSIINKNRDPIEPSSDVKLEEPELKRFYIIPSHYKCGTRRDIFECVNPVDGLRKHFGVDAHESNCLINHYAAAEYDERFKNEPSRLKWTYYVDKNRF